MESESYKKLPQTGEERVYTWDAGGHIITEGPKSNPYEVRYIYSGNAKIAMIRNNQTYYFINDIQGTPERITDSTGKVVQKIQMDEWGRVECYYDPMLGRFISEDPAGQGLNAYAYCGNNPCMYVDADGEWFVPFITAVIAAAGTSAAVSIVSQYFTTGTVRLDYAGEAALSGAVSGALSFGVGQLGAVLKLQEGTTSMLEFKTVAHGISGGIQAELFGGQFGAGVAGGMVGNLGGHFMGDDVPGRILVGGFAGGVAEGVSGGDFAKGFGLGFQSGAYNALFNFGLHEGKEAMKKFMGQIGHAAESVPDPVYDVANVTGGVIEVAAYGTAAAPFVAAGNIVLNGGSLYRDYRKYGASWKMAGAIALTAIPVKKLAPVYGPLANYTKTTMGLIYGNTVK